MLSHQAARAKVIEVVSARASAAPHTETIEFASDPSRALGRILAENVIADRNYPPFDRSTRDGFAVRAADAGLLLKRREGSGRKLDSGGGIDRPMRN